MEQATVYEITGLKYDDEGDVVATGFSLEHGMEVEFNLPKDVNADEVSLGDAIYVAFFKRGEDVDVDAELDSII